MNSKVVERLPGRGVAGALRTLGLGFALTLSCLTALSQTNFGRIVGSITDQTGGSLANAKVTVTDVARGTSRALEVDAAGQFSAPNLTPGTYTVKAEAAGFKTLERENITVITGQDIAVDLTLQPGEQTQTVTVTEELPQVNTTSSVVSSAIENKDLAELPVNGRNYVGMTDLRPGIQTNPGGGTDARRSNNQASEENIWLMDGLNARGIYGGNPVLGAGNLAGEGATLVPFDTIQEVAFVENPKAEYGFGTGAVINLGFKSGTNLLHGTAYAYGRWSGINAQNPFAAIPVNVSLEQFGNSIGGPIKKDKIFFFGGYEGKRTSSSATTSAKEPTTAAGPGTSNSFPDAIAALEAQGFCNPAFSGCSGAKQISPLSLALAGCTMTSASSAATCSTTTGLFANSGQSITVPVQVPNFQHTDNFLAKLDDLISDRNSLHGEYFLGTGNTYSTCGSSPMQPYWGCTTPVRGQGVAIVDVWTPSSNWVNELRGGWHRFDQVIGIGECGNNGAISSATPTQSATDKSNLVAGSPNYVTQYGLVTGAAQACAFPSVTVGTFTALGNQARGYEPRLDTAWKGNDGLSWTHGKHLTKFGMEYRIDYLAGGARGSSQGVVSFGTGGINAPNVTSATALEDYLVGYTSSSQILTGIPETNTINHFYAGYIEDDWRLTNRFTANLGLRYEFSPPLSEADQLFGSFFPASLYPNLPQSQLPTGIAQVGTTPGAPTRLYNPQYDNFAPRLGFAWDIWGKGKTIFRAGSGWMYQTVATSGILGNGNVGPNNTPTGVPFYGLNGQAVATPVGGTQSSAIVVLPSGTWAANTPIFPTAALSCGPGAYPGAVTPAGQSTPPAECAVGGFAQNLQQPRMYYWNADIQRVLPAGMSLDVAYVGNHTADIWAQSNQNQPTAGFANSSKLQAGSLQGTSYIEESRQPFFNNYPWIGAVRWFSNMGISNYNSLQTTLTEHLSHGLNFTATYVLAHALDEVPGVLGSSNYENNYNPRADYGSTSTDPRHRFTLTASYAPPSHKAPLQMLSGWRINTVVYMITRIPYNAADTTNDISGTGVKLDRWDLVGNPHDFQFGQGLPGAGGFPCYGITGSSFASAANCTTVPLSQLGNNLSAAPAAFQVCVNDANNLPANTSLPSTAGAPVTNAPSTAGNTALYNLYKYGCYVNNGTVILPPAQGLYGTMTRDELRGINQRQWDASLTKEWKLTERVSTQYRLEVYNVLNAVHYSSPSANLASPSTFGQSTSTLNLGGIAIAAGAPRQMQMGLKIIF